VGGVSLDDIQAILNMRDAWKYTLENIDETLTLPVLCKMNEYISRNESLAWGVLRTGTVGISGTDYRPPLPVWEDAEQELAALTARGLSITEGAIDLFLWGVRKQLFWDGNKRTSLLAANKLLIAAGKGMLTITEKNMHQFNTLLSAYYDTGAGAVLKAFLYNHAIDGIIF
jgi:hypothetical protein